MCTKNNFQPETGKVGSTEYNPDFLAGNKMLWHCRTLPQHVLFQAYVFAHTSYTDFFRENVRFFAKINVYKHKRIRK